MRIEDVFLVTGNTSYDYHLGKDGTRLYSLGLSSEIMVFEKSEMKQESMQGYCNARLDRQQKEKCYPISQGIILKNQEEVRNFKSAEEKKYKSLNQVSLSDFPTMPC